MLKHTWKFSKRLNGLWGHNVYCPEEMGCPKHVVYTVVVPWFGWFFFLVFHQLFYCREWNNWYNHTGNDGEHCLTSYSAFFLNYLNLHSQSWDTQRITSSFFWMVPKWLTIYLANYVVNQWPTAFSLISNPSAFEVLYLVKYFGGFKYFIFHDIKNWLKNAVTLLLLGHSH